MQKAIYVQKYSFRGILQERCSANMNQTYSEAIMQKCDLKKATLSFLLRSHPRTVTPLKIRSTPAERPFPGEHLRDTASVYQKSFKRLKF